MHMNRLNGNSKQMLQQSFRLWYTVLIMWMETWNFKAKKIFIDPCHSKLVASNSYLKVPTINIFLQKLGDSLSIISCTGI